MAKLFNPLDMKYRETPEGNTMHDLVENASEAYVKLLKEQSGTASLQESFQAGAKLGILVSSGISRLPSKDTEGNYRAYAEGMSFRLEETLGSLYNGSDAYKNAKLILEDFKSWQVLIGHRK